MIRNFRNLTSKRPFALLAVFAIPVFLAATIAKLALGKGKAPFVSCYCYAS